VIHSPIFIRLFVGFLAVMANEWEFLGHGFLWINGFFFFFKKNK
jgi:hypothetical protein